MIPALANHLWQSTFVALAAGLLAAALRANRAQVRYWIWFGASLKFLVPFALLTVVGSHLVWLRPETPRVQAVTPAVSVAAAVAELTQPVPMDLPTAVPQPDRQRPWLPSVLAGVWASGLVTIGLLRLRGWRRIRRAVRASQPFEVPGGQPLVPVRSSPGLLEPGVVGIWRPLLLVPAGITAHLAPRQFDAVLTHELCHVRRRDNLTATVHMAVETVCWFHPLVWWIGARLIEERERACDEAVLTRGFEPLEYTSGILNVCKMYVESPMACVSGVTGSDLKKRIGAIRAGRVGFDLSSSRKAILVLATVAALAVPVVAGVVTAPLQTPSPATGPLPPFAAVSVRPCDPTTPPPPAPSGAGRSGGPRGAATPGRLNFPCYSLLDLVRLSYGLYANGRVNSRSEQPVFPMRSDLPDWISQENFAVEAKADGEPPALIMLGPMLQRVLEDQFKLKVHRETRVVPVYELVLAKGGPKLTLVAPGTCVEYDYGVSPQPTPPPGQHRCTNHNEMDATNSNTVYFMELITLADYFSGRGPGGGFGQLDRQIVNKTGINGPVAFRLAIVGQATDPGGWLSLYNANLRRDLGLELRPGKDPIDFLVIDHAEKPALQEQVAPTAGRMPARAQGPGR